MSTVRSIIDAQANLQSYALAYTGVCLITAVYLWVLGSIAGVAGLSGPFILISAGAFALAVFSWRYLTVWLTLFLSVTLVTGGLLLYLQMLPPSQVALLTPESILSDSFALLTGLSILRFIKAGLWTLAIVPGPLFLSWTFALERRFGHATLAGGLLILLVTLSGDATPLMSLVGTIGGVCALFGGTAARFGGFQLNRDILVATLAAITVLSLTISVIPGGSAPVTSSESPTTVEANLVSASDRIAVLGSIELSPEVRFSVESSQRSYLRTAAYDRYTGDGWVRSGETKAYRARLRGPPGPSKTVTQTIYPSQSLGVIPTAWKPVEVNNSRRADVRVTDQGGLRPQRQLSTNESLTVESEVPQWTPDELRATETEYPADIETLYLQLPDSTPERVKAESKRITADTSNPYDTAVAVEEYLESQKNYSLDVEAPDGNVADAFLFEMQAGYCTYYATTMVTMLRAEGIPARFVTGYTPGESVDSDRYVVRGLNSHAWVEVYFSGVGWVRFDPTPASPRQTAEQDQVSTALQSDAGNPNIGQITPLANSSSQQSSPAQTETTNSERINTPSAASQGDETDGSDTSFLTDISDAPEQLITAATQLRARFDLLRLFTVFLAGVSLVGAVESRYGYLRSSVRILAAQRQRRSSSPTATVERAYERVIIMLEWLYRSRLPTESHRSYVESLPADEPDLYRLLTIYERSQYDSSSSSDEATEAQEIANRLVRRYTPIIRRFFD